MQIPDIAFQSKREKTRRIVFLMMLIAWMGVIFFFSNMQAVESRALSSSLNQKLLSAVVHHYEELPRPVQNELKQNTEVVLRKAAHALEYFTLGVLSILALKKKTFSRKVFLTTALICLGYAVSDEWHQTFVSGRACLPTDVMIDSISAAVGAIAPWRISARSNR